MNTIPPKYKRQRLALALLETAGGQLSKMDMQKLMFLYLQEQNAVGYSFVPYRYGCYSFQLADDMDLMSKRNWIAEQDTQYKLLEPVTAQPWAKSSLDLPTLQQWSSRKKARGGELVASVYREHPYYAIRSEIKQDLLNTDDLHRIDREIPVFDPEETVLHTVGYEGKQFEDYLNELLQAGIQVLVDVRNNPLSRKFGFSKSALNTLLPKFDIQYIHIPELGIESSSRKNLDNANAYEVLFEAYRDDLPNRDTWLTQLRQILRDYKRIAITCFEAEPHQCHRHCISDYLATNHKVQVQHL